MGTTFRPYQPDQAHPQAHTRSPFYTSTTSERQVSPPTAALSVDWGEVARVRRFHAPDDRNLHGHRRIGRLTPDLTRLARAIETLPPHAGGRKATRPL